jgi:DNA-binding transcriptional ArsR family regulator
VAVLRGHSIDPTVAESHLERLARLKTELIATKTPDKEALQVFLDEAGGVELADLGEAFSRAEATRRTRIGNLLIGFLADPDWNRRDSAARILGAMGVREAVKPLRQLVFQPAEERLARLAALRSLDRLGGLTPDEIAMLRLDSSPLIRDEADRLLADLE